MGNTNYTKLGLIFFIVGMILALIAAIPLLFMMQDFMNISNITSISDASGLLATIVILGILGFIGLVLYLVAYILMCVGGIAYREYGDKHRKFLLITLIILISLIVVAIIQGILQMMAVGAAASSNDLSGLVNIYYLPVATAIFGGLFYIFLIHELSDIKGRIMLYIYYGSSIAITVIIAVLNIINFDNWAANTMKLIEESNSGSGFLMGMDIGSLNAQNTINQAFSIETMKYSAYSIIPSIFIFIALILAFYRIHRGELKPIPKPSVNVRRCPNCGMEIPQYSESCPKCGQYIGTSNSQQFGGTSLKFCPNCGHKNEEGKTYCEECGTQF